MKGKSGSHEENGDHLLLFHHSSLVVPLDYYRDVGTIGGWIPRFLFFYRLELLRLSTNLNISNPFGFDISSLGCQVMLSLRIGSWWFWMVGIETS